MEPYIIGIHGQPNALTAASVINSLHMLLQAGVPDPPLLPVPACFSMTVPDHPAALNSTID